MISATKLEPSVKAEDTTKMPQGKNRSRDNTAVKQIKNMYKVGFHKFGLPTESVIRSSTDYYLRNSVRE